VPALVRLRRRYVCVSLTILSLSLVIDVSRRNAILWDAVIPCEITATRVVPTQDASDRRAPGQLPPKQGHGGWGNP
jgi:hypothetical protein